MRPPPSSMSKPLKRFHTSADKTCDVSKSLLIPKRFTVRERFIGEVKLMSPIQFFVFILVVLFLVGAAVTAWVMN